MNKLSNVFGAARTVLTWRGVHWIATRLGGRTLARWSFNEKFRAGDWGFDRENDDLVTLIERHCAGGSILILGCGKAVVLQHLSPRSYHYILGLDISTEAIKQAQKYASSKVKFEVGDMTKYDHKTKFDLILMLDSLYYVAPHRRMRFLRNIRSCLSEGGRIMVTVAQPERFGRMLDIIRGKFTVFTDRCLEKERRHLLIFA